MGIAIIYFLIIILANSIGAISGMGGGVIIKPLLDLIGYHSLTEITFYSSVAVFTMSISSTYKQIKNKIKIDWPKAITVSVGSMVGGVLGNKLFFYLVDLFQDEGKVQLIQIILTVISLILVLIYQLWLDKKLYLKNLGAFFIVGLFLGGFSTLLGIGGGPINVTLLVFCFGLPIKDATVYSIITIFFSQLAKIVGVYVTTHFEIFDLNLLLVIIPAALIGGYVGGLLSGKFSDKMVAKIFIGVVLLVMGINLFNLIQII